MPVSASQRLHPSWSKDDLSIAYVGSVAAAAGVSLEVPHRDINSIDAVFSGTDDEVSSAPALKAQLKCTATRLTTSTDHPGMWRFPLKAKNYNDLRRTDVFPPRILIVVACPPFRPDWIIHAFSQALVLQAQAWWVNLSGLPAIDEDQGSKTVSIPRDQRFDTTALLANMCSYS